MLDKKKVCIAAVAGLAVVTSGIALAKKDTNTPTLYGKVFVTADSRDNQEVGSEQVNSNGSRIGIKGKLKTDLKGVDVIYKLEFGVDVAGDSDTALTNRDQYVGLASKKLGTLVAGTHNTALKDVGRKIDLFNNYYLGDITTAFFGEERLGSTLAYTSPEFYGVTVNFSNHAELANAADNTYKAHSYALAYNGVKNLYLAVAGEKNTLNLLTMSNREHVDVSSTRLVTQYAARNYTVGLIYQTTKADAEDAKSLPATMLNGSYTHKNLTYKLQYTTSEQQIGQGGASTGKTDTDKSSTVTTLGVDYALSKKSTAVAYYSAQDFTAESGQEATKSNTVFGVGLVHNF